MINLCQFCERNKPQGRRSLKVCGNKQNDKPGFVVGRSSIWDYCCQQPLATYQKARRAAVSLSIWSCFEWSLHVPALLPGRR